MELDREVFRIDPQAVAAQIEDFIRSRMEQLHRSGIAVGISGGLDSSTVAALCARAVGPERVTGLILREKQGNPEATRYARRLARHLGIRAETVDISPLLRELGVYSTLLSRLPGRRLRGLAVNLYRRRTGNSPYLRLLRGEAREVERNVFATINAKHRARLLVAYRVAESRNLMVVGSAHKTEDLIGLYVKYGIDDCADLMPFKNLFRSHIMQLAEHVGVPREITARPSNPDIIPGVEDKYADLLGLASEALDLVLHRLEQGMSSPEIAGHTGLSREKVAEVQEIFRLTAHMRQHSMAPRFEFTAARE